MTNLLPVLDHGYVKLLNIAGPTRRAGETYTDDFGHEQYESPPAFDAADTDPANVARTSFDQRDSGRTREQDLKLCDYLLRNHHTTPFEMVQVWLEMKLPIVVARQFVRHRTVSINEISGRYVELPAEWYIPPADQIGIKAESNKQGRDRSVEQPSREWFRDELHEDCRRSYDRYQLALEHGIPPELARLFLHVNHYTKWVWRQDLHNMMHFLSLRDHSQAQWEAQEYARAITELLRQQLPDLMNLYDKYRRQR
jgi:thymidylate synthase (FAD)